MDTYDLLKSALDNSDSSYAKIGLVDLDGVLRGKYLSAAKLLAAADKDLSFCNVVLGWDVKDELHENGPIIGWETGFSDAAIRLIPESVRELPFADRAPFFLCEFTGESEKLCPRGLLRRMLDKAKSMGFEVRAAFEYEFFVFDETSASLRTKGYRNLTPLTEGPHGYSLLRSGQQSSFYQALLDGCATAGIAIECLHEETGPGVMEAAITVDDGLQAADNAALFKFCAKLIASNNDKVATFMAKCSDDWPGQSGHIHVSLTRPDGTPVFDTTDAGEPGETMSHFIGGQQRLMPELLAMVSPTVNSYTRMVPGYWAPTSATWGLDNRTTALRAITGNPKANRVEYRLAAADANPYLALAAAVGSGIYGVENRLSPSDPVAGNAYEQEPENEFRLPDTLFAAAQRLKQSTAARTLFGDDFVMHFAASREWEERQFRKHVTDWELERYLEII